MTAAQIAKQAQMAGKNASDSFNRFVEGSEQNSRSAPLDESKKGFWDDFAGLAEQRKPSNSAIGTSAMGMGKTKSAAAPAKPKQQDEWDDW